jgi:DNA ligase (NAD+)
MTDAEIRKLSVDELEKLVRHHNRLYFVENKPVISDYEFDRLTRRLRDSKPNSSALTEFVETPELGRRVVHEAPMLSLDKCYEPDELAHWADQVQGDFLVMPKIDGAACSIVYGKDGKLERAATRGDGEAGEDVTQNVRHIRDIPRKIASGPLEVRGEVYMKLSDFAGYKAEFVNPRNLAAGALKLKDLPEKPYPLSFFGYDARLVEFDTEAAMFRRLEKLGFTIVPWEVMTREKLQDAYEQHMKRRGERDFEVDGVVYRANRISERRRLGETAHHPRWAIAYKFQGDSATTRLVSVEWSVSRTGAITPIGIVEPVFLSGATVSRCSLHNVGLIGKLQLKLNARVVAMRRGGVIPHIESVVKPGDKPIEIPTECPVSGHPTRLDGDFLFCSKPDECTAAIVGRLAHYVGTLEVDGFGEKILAQLVEKKLVRTIPDLYRLTLEKLLSLERMGEILAKKLVANLQAKRSVPLSVFLCSLGVDDLGPHVAGILARMADGRVDRVLSISEAELAGVHGVGSITASTVLRGLAEKRKLIEELEKILTIEAPSVADNAKAKLKGKSFVFTGALKAMTRSAAQKLVRDLGAETPSSVTKTLSHLVVGDDEREGKPTGKRAKAEDYNRAGSQIAILSEAEFLGLIESVRSS